MKPLSWCWSYFKRTEDVDANGKQVVVGTGNFCGWKTSNKADRMERHLENCNKVGAESRKQIDRLLKKPASTEESPQPKKTKLTDASEVSSQTSSRMLGSRFDTTTNDNQEELDILLTRAFATGNIAPNFLDNPFLQQFIAKVRPSYKLPTRNYKYPKVLIPAEFDRVTKALEESCSKADYLAISSDGWTDVQSNDNLKIIITTIDFGNYQVITMVITTIITPILITMVIIQP